MGARGKPRLFLWVITKTSRDKIKAVQMDVNKTKWKQKNVNRIFIYCLHFVLFTSIWLASILSRDVFVLTYKNKRDVTMLIAVIAWRYHYYLWYYSVFPLRKTFFAYWPCDEISWPNFVPSANKICNFCRNWLANFLFSWQNGHYVLFYDRHKFIFTGHFDRKVVKKYFQAWTRHSHLSHHSRSPWKYIWLKANGWCSFILYIQLVHIKTLKTCCKKFIILVSLHCMWYTELILLYKSSNMQNKKSFNQLKIVPHI